MNANGKHAAHQHPPGDRHTPRSRFSATAGCGARYSCCYGACWLAYMLGTAAPVTPLPIRIPIRHDAIPTPISRAGTAADSSAKAKQHYGFDVVSKLRFDRNNFTQGLEIHDGRLYVSSGLYGQSVIRVYTFPELELLHSVPVDPRIFAEGLTVIGDRLILLSWRERVMLVYSLPDCDAHRPKPAARAGLGCHPQWFSALV